MNQEIIKLNEIIKKDYQNIAGMVVLKDKEVIYEQYFNDCDKDTSIHIFSVTKSIVSLLIGIAVDKGYIKNLNQRVLDFFPDYIVKRGEKQIQNITLKDLMTMTAPYKYVFAPYTKYFTSHDWVKSSLDLLGGKGKIGDFRYTPVIGPDILSGILVKTTGKSVFDFATENLFEPLDIKVERSIVFEGKEDQMAFYKAKGISGWVADDMGNNTAGWGLTLNAMDMAKIGQLCLQKGMWDNRQIVSESWIEACMSKHSRWDKMDLDFGYLWWINSDGYAAVGDGGNVIYVNTEKNLVVSIASLFKPRVKDRIDFIKTIVEPLFD